MTKSTTVQLIYMTPSLEGLEGVDPADEFEDLDDLARRAKLPGIEAVINKALVYYLYLLDARESKPKRVMIARPYDSQAGVVLDDEECGDYHQADCRDLDIEIGTLDTIRKRADLETIDELLKRSLILFEKVVQAREAGWGVALYDERKPHNEWLFDENNSAFPATRHGPGKPTLQ